MQLPLGDQAFLFSGELDLPDRRVGELIAAVAADAPFRHMEVPGGRRMSVAMTSCGDHGWVTDRSGYRYSPVDPTTGRPWPPMPPEFRALAADFAGRAGFPGFEPDSCLVNRYARDAKMGLHQDRDEESGRWPIVSVSVGLTGRFAFGGHARTDPVRRVDLHSGDVVVWGGVDRFRFHGIDRATGPTDPVFGDHRYNLTLRRSREGA
ncbi:DNA oxidative demethylase AlkB [Corynebacterium bovis]|uniref:Alkylated DNA repair protein (DNA oxidative demethylase) n=1 Tax=Corynebacterium bovis DSM 20582 = CIP 54.80 TaxID=927655 RepID=A0A8H9YBI3_9CORY|nr:DNA oxidative demethylase AlkB [Corynebacterium bovis]MBB3116021.1 alkylated DNA repair protein (DNA oxidative demethylase) [Corynebacterium bovis DSM 20582 = CIP 54.80]QQC46958.1 DNA oxidative demethylase AlkB [Corynebacterium bovis]WJY76607.1 Alpha-ketoglutarate-dependent dioxygenase AlkB [Corynebacterium bovis DSM 20582 = CIP 54.80]